jgi:6-phosphogluconolactonase
VTFAVETFSAHDFARGAAATITQAAPDDGSIVLTGGTTARAVYEQLASVAMGWPQLDVFFSDERCVPPDDDSSNYKLAKETILDKVQPRAVYRMRGEDPPNLAADRYHDAVQQLVGDGFDLLLLGMGAEGHIGAIFPGSPALTSDALCVQVERPDGLTGLTLTPTAMLPAKQILLIVTGERKAEAVARAVTGDEDAEKCPVRVLAEHPHATFLLDEGAAARLNAQRSR